MSLKSIRFFAILPYMKQAVKNKKISFRPTLFWDVDPKKVHPRRNAQYVVERILDFGNDREVRWMMHYYPAAFIKKTIATSRTLDPKSRALWSLVW